MAYNLNTGSDQALYLTVLSQRFFAATQNVGSGLGYDDVFKIGTIHDYNDSTNKGQPFLIVEYPTSRMPNIRKPLEYYDFKMYMFCVDNPSSGSGNTYFDSTKSTSGTKIYSRMQDWYMSMYDSIEQTSLATQRFPYFDGQVRFTPRGKVGQDAAWCLQMDCTLRVYRGHADTHTADVGEDDN